MSGVHNCGVQQCCATLQQQPSETKYDWADLYKCNKCQCSIYICSLCYQKKPTSGRRHASIRFTRHRLNRHHAQHHSKDMIHVNKRAKVDNMAHKSISTSNIFSEIGNNESTSTTTNDTFSFPYDRRESTDYFAHNASTETPNKGPSYLVGMALCNTNSSYKYISDDDIVLHLLMATFVSSLTRNQRIEFGFILELINKKLRKQNETKDSAMNNSSDETKKEPSILTRIPDSDADLRRWYTIGSHSILQNLPHPKITILDNHSYVSVKQCIADFLGKGYAPDKVSDVNKDRIRRLVDSPIAHQVYNRARNYNKGVDPSDLIVLMGVQWSDDFEPNGSSKSNRGSVWLKTLTFVSDSYSNNELSDTYPVSIGLKSDNHDVIEHRFINDCADLRNGKNNIFYYMREKRNIYVHFELIASLGDQPERRSMNYLMLGNSTYLSRYRYIANVGAIWRNLPCCVDCYNGMRKYPHFLSTNIKCDKCVTWNLMSQSPLMNYVIPKNYPCDIKGDDTTLKPEEITFELLKNTVTTATTNLMEGKWSETSTFVYCGAHGINVQGTKKLIDSVNNKLALEYHTSKDIQEVNKQNADSLLVDFKRNEKKYDIWCGGPFWNSSLSLNQFVDAIMHLVFLGVTKATQQLINSWIKVTKRSGVFNTVRKDIFKPITAMGLDWCKLLDNESGWVSDNLLAFARVIKWYYYPITTLKPEKKYVEPLTAVNDWTKPMCKEWLKAHGLKIDGKVSDLRTVIVDSRRNKTNPPKLLECNSCTVGDINNCVGSLLSMVSHIMSRFVSIKTTPYKMDREIKLFLNSIHHVDMKLNMKSDKHYLPYWLTKYNYQSLLNLPNAMELYGPLINLWEGANQGEGYLRYAKPIITDIHSVNWHLNAHMKLLSEKAIESVLSYHIAKNSIEEVHHRYLNYVDSKKNRRKKMYVIYDSVIDLYSTLRMNRPISCVRTFKDLYYVIIRENKKVEDLRCVPILFEYAKTIESLSMNFHNINIDMSLTDNDILSVFDVSSIGNFVLLLPELGGYGYTNDSKLSLYYIIDSDWNELNKDMQMISPKTPNCCY